MVIHILNWSRFQEAQTISGIQIISTLNSLLLRQDRKSQLLGLRIGNYQLVNKKEENDYYQDRKQLPNNRATRGSKATRKEESYQHKRDSYDGIHKYYINCITTMSVSSKFLKFGRRTIYFMSCCMSVSVLHRIVEIYHLIQITMAFWYTKTAPCGLSMPFFFRCI